MMLKVYKEENLIELTSQMVEVIKEINSVQEFRENYTFYSTKFDDILVKCEMLKNN